MPGICYHQQAVTIWHNIGLRYLYVVMRSINIDVSAVWRSSGGLQGLKVECLLTSAIWSYGHEAEVYIFPNLPFPSNPKENSSIRCILSTPEQNLLWHIIGCTPNTFHNTINKNVNQRYDTIPITSTNQVSINLLVSVRGILEQNHCQLLLTFCTAAKYGLGWCGPASAVRQLIFDNHVTFM